MGIAHRLAHPVAKDPVPGRGPWLILHGMEADDPREPDVASLFAPVAVEETFAGVLTEARQILRQLDDPVDAELWGSDLIGALPRRPRASPRC